jgi:putative ABC transport system permease protein
MKDISNSSRLSWKLAWKDIRYNRIFTLLFLINMAIGLVGLIVIENFKVSFQDVLENKSRDLLGADLEIAGRFPLTESQKNTISDYLINKGLTQKIIRFEGLSLFSMARSQAGARLVTLRNLDSFDHDAESMEAQMASYPFYGHLNIKDVGKFPLEGIHLPSQGKVWAYPDVLELLQSHEIKLGSLPLKIESIILEDSQQAFDTGPLAPKIYMRSDDLKASGLIRKGSTLTYFYAYKTDVSLSDEDVTALNDLLNDNALRVKVPRNSSEQVGRLLAYLSDFLGLVGLVALFLSSVGLFYLYRGHLSSRRYSLAVYASLGISRKEITHIFIKHIFLLATFGTGLGLLISMGLIPIINQILTYVLPFELSFMMSPRALGIGVLVGMLGVLLLSYPLILAAINIKPASLFEEMSNENTFLNLKSGLHLLPYTLFFAGMSLYSAQSFKVGGIFLGIFIGSLLLGFLLASSLIKLFNRLLSIFNISFTSRLSWKYLSRNKISTLSIFISLLLGSMLLNLIPMIQESIKQEFDVSRDSGRPSLFLFDIQDEQVKPLERYFAEEIKVPLLSLSPLVRARISKVNDVEIKVDSSESLTREEEREKRFRNRGTNLSFRSEMTESESLVTGKWFSGSYHEGDSQQKHPYISVEYRYAERLGIKEGDLVEFSVMGIPVWGKVLNLRKVKWTSFLPNFFIQFQPGVLEDAPKTWLAAVDQIDDEKKKQIQLNLFEDFPNISAVDLSKVVDKILSLMDQMAMALQAMSFICVVVGIFVLYSLAHHQVNSRVQDFVLLKVIGLNEKNLKSMAVKEFALIGFTASFLGALFSLVVANLVSLVFFDGNFVLKAYIPIISVIVITLLCVLTTYWVVNKVIKSKVKDFL